MRSRLSSARSSTRFDPFATSAYSVIDLAKPYFCTAIDPDGLGLLGFSYPATDSPKHLTLPSGFEAPSMYDTSTLSMASCRQLESVSYSIFTTSL